MNLFDHWFTDKAGKIMAGVILQDGKRVAVGDPTYLPVSYGGLGKGRPQKSAPVEDETRIRRDQLPNFHPRFRGITAMTFRVAFAHGTWRDVEADLFTINDDWIAFIRDGQPVLNAVRDTLVFIEPIDPPAEAPFSLK